MKAKGPDVSAEASRRPGIPNPWLDSAGVSPRVQVRRRARVRRGEGGLEVKAGLASLRQLELIVSRGPGRGAYLSFVNQ